MAAIDEMTKINGDATKLETDGEWSRANILIGWTMGMTCVLSFLLISTICICGKKKSNGNKGVEAKAVELPTGVEPEKKPTYVDIGPPEEVKIIPGLLQSDPKQQTKAEEEDGEHYIEIGHVTMKKAALAPLPADQVPGRTPAYRTLAVTNSIFESSKVKKMGATTTMGPMTVVDMKTAMATQSNIRSINAGQSTIKQATPSMAPSVVGMGSMAPASPNASAIQKKGTATMAPQGPSVIQQKKATATMKAQLPAASMKAQLPPAVVSPKACAIKKKGAMSMVVAKQSVVFG